MISDRTLRTVIPSARAVGLYGDVIRVVTAALVIAAIGVCLLYYAAIGRLMANRLHMNDFGKFYYSARMFLEGRDMYGPSPATAIPVGEEEVRQFLNMNPPQFHLLLLPLARLEPLAALTVWAIANLAALAISIRLIMRELGLTLTIARALWLILGILAFSATGAVVVTGQLAFLLTLVVTLAWRAARRGRWAASAVWLGIGTGLKPFLGIFWIYMLLRKQFRPAAIMAAVVAASFVTGVAIFGTAALQSWVRAVSSVDWTWPPMNSSFAGFFSRTFAPGPFFTSPVNAPRLVGPGTLIAVSAVIIASWRSMRRDPAHVDSVFLILLLMVQLITPLGWIYYLWLSCGPAVAIWRARPSRDRAQTVLALIALPGLVTPLLIIGQWRHVAWATPTLGSLYFWTTLAIWMMVLRARSVANSGVSPERGMHTAGGTSL